MRGVVRSDVNGKVLDANAIRRADPRERQRPSLRKDRLAFTDGEGRRPVATFCSRPMAVPGPQARLPGSRARKTGPAASKPRGRRGEDQASAGRKEQGARQLYAGLSVEETAVRLGLSLNTVLSHLKQIFFKCEVQSQVELMHTLALGPQSF
ncbi:MAG: hypothetical protein IPF50_15915 [Proteobacteria bacterium]|nr:hypothetical protein [Pseudomonadota bacterium]